MTYLCSCIQRLTSTVRRYASRPRDGSCDRGPSPDSTRQPRCGPRLRRWPRPPSTPVDVSLRPRLTTNGLESPAPSCRPEDRLARHVGDARQRVWNSRQRVWNSRHNGGRTIRRRLIRPEDPVNCERDVFLSYRRWGKWPRRVDEHFRSLIITLIGDIAWRPED